MCLCWVGPLWCQDQQRTYIATIAQDSFIVVGYEISSNISGQWKTVARFTVPTVSLLLQYRPYVRNHFGFNETEKGFIDVVEDVSSTIDTAFLADGKLWVGFGFYEGEGWEGYGGIGFYDPKTKKVGVLRHPALIDYSVKAMMVTDTMLYVQTIGNYEIESTVGNGLVMINRRSLEARALVPPGTSTSRNKDDTASVAPLYNKPIPELLRDNRLVEKSVPQYVPTLAESIQAIGIDSFMIKTAHEEKATRNRAASKAKITEDVLKFPRPDNGWLVKGENTSVELNAGILSSFNPGCAINGITHFIIQVTGAFPFSENFGIRPAYVYPGLIDDDKRYMLANEGDSWIRETSRIRLLISIDTLKTQNKSCSINGKPKNFQYFSSVVVRIEVRTLQE